MCLPLAQMELYTHACQPAVRISGAEHTHALARLFCSSVLNGPWPGSRLRPWGLGTTSLSFYYSLSLALALKLFFIIFLDYDNCLSDTFCSYIG